MREEGSHFFAMLPTVSKDSAAVHACGKKSTVYMASAAAHKQFPQMH